MKDLNGLSFQTNSYFQDLEQSPVNIGEQFMDYCSEPTSAEKWVALIPNMKTFETSQGTAIRFNPTDDFVTIDSKKSMRAFFDALVKEDYVGICFDQLDFSEGVWQVILEEVSKNKKLVHLGVEGCVFSEACIPRENEYLISCLQKQIQTLVIHDVSLTKADAKFFKAFFQGNKTLEDLRLTNLTTENECEGLLAAGFHSCKNLKNLDLSGSQFSPRMSKITAEIISELSNLESLALRDMPTLDGLANWSSIANSASLRDLCLCANKNLDDEFVLNLLQNLLLDNLDMQNSTYSAENLTVALACYQTRENISKLQILVDDSSPCLSDMDFQDFFSDSSPVQITSSGSPYSYEEKLSPEKFDNSANEKVKAEQELRELLSIQKREYENLREQEKGQLLLYRIKQGLEFTPELNTAMQKFESAIPGMTYAIKEAAFDLVLEKFNLVKEKVPKDGNCLFHSILRLHKFENEAFIPPGLRNKLVELMRPHASKYGAFVGGEDFDDMEIDDPQDKWDIYCDLMTNQAMFPGPIELNIMAQFLNRRIEVYDPNYGFIFDEDNNLQLADGMVYGQAKPGVPPIRLYRSFDHFSPLIRK